MDLPNYFLADLPPEAEITAALITESCRNLRRNRERFLAERTTDMMIALLARVARDWLDEEHPLRQRTLAEGPAATGFSRESLAAGLEAFFQSLTEESLRTLVEQDLGKAQRLDAFCAGAAEQTQSRHGLAIGPELLVHITAGNVPNPALMSLVLGLLTRSAQFAKCAGGAAFLPRLFAHSIHLADTKVGACLEIAEWKGGHSDLDTALFAEADCVTATGSDETLAAVWVRLPARVRFVGHGHRLSFGFIARNAGGGVRRLAERAAIDVTAWDQLGCLSPHVFYVERGGAISPADFAKLLAGELAAREAIEPRGALPTEQAAHHAARRAFYEVRAANSSDTMLWASEQSTAWTVVFENDPRFPLSCLHRFIYVKAVDNLDDALWHTGEWQGKISTVALAAEEGQIRGIAQQLARWGVTRVCPLGRMQQPPTAWRHDGRPALGDLVTWCDWEE